MQITLIGLDTLGISLGLALKAVAPDITVIGHDRDRERGKAATQAKAIDKAHWNLLAACDGSELVVLNEPLDQVETELSALAPELPAETVVLVLSGVQRPLQTMLGTLTPQATFLGGRFVSRTLLAGAEPDAELLQDALLYIIAPPTAPEAALHKVVSLGEAVGARVCFMDAAEHDGVAAPTGQLPRLLALVLLATVTNTDAQRDLDRVLDPALAQFAAHLSTGGHADELLANSDNLARWLTAYAGKLEQFAGWLREGDQQRLSDETKAATEALERWGQMASPSTEEMPSPLGLRQLFLGQRRSKRDV